MFRRLSLALAGAGLLVAMSVGGTMAAQPFASCGSAGAEMMPHGFTTTGFATAELVYAGSEDSHSADNAHAVSQYDIACVHFTSAHQ